MKQISEGGSVSNTQESELLHDKRLKKRLHGTSKVP